MGLNSIQVTRFSGGVTNRPENDILGGSFKAPDPTLYHTFFEDFDYYTAADWTVTEVGVATQALTDADGGVLLVTNAAADNDSSSSQKVGESFTLETGKKLFFKSRLAVSDATLSDVLVGLLITDTAPFDVTDGIFFLKSEGSAEVGFFAEKDSVQESAAGVVSMEDATMIELSFLWDGVDRLYYGADGNVLGYIEPDASLPDDEVLTVSFAVRNGEAVAKTLSVDYLFIAKER